MYGMISKKPGYVYRYEIKTGRLGGKMNKVKRIINYISWIIILALTAGLLIRWGNIPESVIMHIGFGQISYGSKNMLLVILAVEILLNIVFTLGYDVSFIREMRKTKQSAAAVGLMSAVLQIIAVIVMGFFILAAII